MLNYRDSQGNTHVNLDIGDANIYDLSHQYSNADGTPPFKGEVSFYEPTGALIGLLLAGVLFKKKTGPDYALTLVLGGIAGYIGGAFVRTFAKKSIRTAVVAGGDKPIEGVKQGPVKSEFAGNGSVQERKCPEGYYYSTDSKGKGRCYKQPTLRVKGKPALIYQNG